MIAAVERLTATGRIVLLSVACAWKAPRDSAEWVARAPVIDSVLALAGGPDRNS